jgi:hypothetical protein
MVTVGQVCHIKMPSVTDPRVEIRLRTFVPKTEIFHEPVSYWLSKSHPAYSDNLGLLVAGSMQGHVMTFEVADVGNEILCVAIENAPGSRQ